jgi:hypothetical protein
MFRYERNSQWLADQMVAMNELFGFPQLQPAFPHNGDVMEVAVSFAAKGTPHDTGFRLARAFIENAAVPCRRRRNPTLGRNRGPSNVS